MRDIKRVFLIVLDSFGAGQLPDAEKFGDAGAYTLKSCYDTGKLNVPCMQSMGLFNIDGITNFSLKSKEPICLSFGENQ